MGALKKHTDLADIGVAKAPPITSTPAPTEVDPHARTVAAGPSPARDLQGDLATRLSQGRGRAARMRATFMAGLGLLAVVYCAAAWIAIMGWLMDIRPGS